jgi:protein gp37
VSDKSAIEWTDATWNPTTGCDRVSPGCANCYALDLAARLKKMGAPAYQRDGDPRTSGPGFGLTLHPDKLDLPLRWRTPRRVFVNSMSDLVHPDVPDEYVARVWSVMASATRHTFQVLTKRPERMQTWAAAVALCEHGWLTHNGDNPRSYRSTVAEGDGTGEIIFDGRQTLVPSGRRLPDGREIVHFAEPVAWPTPNVWLGTSIENDRWTIRADHLRETPAAVRFLSCEPLLGPLPSLDLTGIGWVIVGGESGPNHRPIDPAWVRDIRDRCVEAGVPFFFKQWGGRTPKSGGRVLDGRTWDEMP